MTASTQAMSAMFYRGQQDRCDYLNPSTALAVGSIVDLEERIGVVTAPEGIPATGAVGALGALAIAGIFRLAKATAVTAAVFQQGDQVWWDTSALTAYNAPGSNRIYAGLADEAAPSTHNDVKTDINKLPAQQVIASMYGAGTTTTTTTS
jgi:predicted RecA/RadA family phage recombinase